MGKVTLTALQQASAEHILKVYQTKLAAVIAAGCLGAGEETP